MTNLDIALLKRISHIVRVENRTFSHVDFVPCFEVDGTVFNIVRGTFKNKISKMVKRGELKIVCYSPQGFFTLKGLTVEIPLNEDHIGQRFM